MKPITVFITRRLWILLLVLTIGCGGAFGRAMNRGSELMETHQWDAAAAEFEQALKLKPNHPEAQAKLRQVRVHQAAERVERAKPMMRGGDIEEALVILQEAASFDPANTEAKTLMDEATEKVLDRAEAQLEAGEMESAFALTTLALKGKPDNTRAQQIDNRARQSLADRAYRRADDLETAGKLGAALTELGSATTYVPGFKESESRMASLKGELTKRLRYHVVIGTFASDPKVRDIADQLSSTTMGRGTGTTEMLSVSRQPPPRSEGYAGMRLGGKVFDYGYDHRQSASSRSCTYVCGTTTKRNQRYDELERALSDAKKAERIALSDIKKIEPRLAEAQRAHDDAARDVDRAKLEVDRAKLDLERCEQKADPNDPQACAPETKRVEEEVRRLGAAEARLEGPAQRLEEAKTAMDDAEKRRDQASSDVAYNQEHLDKTSATISVDRTCDHRYEVTSHKVVAAVSVTMKAEGLHDRSVVIPEQTSSYSSSDDDIGFVAQQGRCAEVAKGDPVELKGEPELRRELSSQASAKLAEQIRSQYEKYRRSYLDQARQQSRAGLVDEAVDSYISYLLTTPSEVAQKEAPEARSFIEQSKGLSDEIYDRLLR